MLSNPWNPKEAPLQPVISNHFMITTLKKEYTVEEFKEEKNLRKKSSNVFIEYREFVKKDLIRDVILIEKVITTKLQSLANCYIATRSCMRIIILLLLIIIFQKTGKLFTGPTARSKPSAYLDEYRVFVLRYDSNLLTMKCGHSVLHQVYI